MVATPEALLRQLADGDEQSLRQVLTPAPSAADRPGGQSLDTRTATLVALGALLALDASTASLRWAVERACCTGAGADEIVAVLLSAAPAAGAAQLVASAPRLALALDFDVELEGWDGS
jgi:alkylhydroperoxidase/carboxymuconolactone decarboxylase family protein YurZ